MEVEVDAGSESAENDVYFGSVTLKSIRNCLVGNLKQKRCLLNDGILLRILEVWNMYELRMDILCELAVIIGSLAQGLPETVKQLLNSGFLDLLVNGLFHDDNDVVFCFLKSLSHIYATKLAPSELIFENLAVVQLLISFLKYPPPFSISAAIILSIACQTSDHQCLLLNNDFFLTMLHTLISTKSTKTLSSALQCLCSVIKNNSSLATINELSSLLSLLSKYLSFSPSKDVKLYSAMCLTNVYKINVLMSDDIILLKLIPTLVYLCKPDSEHNDMIRIQAAFTLADLVSGDCRLQEAAASTDDLLPSLASFFHDRPDVNNEFTDDCHIQSYENLCESSLSLLSLLCSTVEDVRFKVVSQPNIMQYFTQCLQSDFNVNIKIAAVRCLISLSRSTKLLRTYLSDVELSLSKLILEMLSSTNEDLVSITASLLCNLLLSFCPCRELMIQEGIITVLCCLTIHDNSSIQLNAVWSLMNCAQNANQDVVREIRLGLPINQLLELLQQPHKEEQFIVKCLGLLINLTQNVLEADLIMDEQGSVLAQCMGSLLALYSSDTVCEQILCILVNIANGSCRSRDIIAETALVMECLAQVLRTSVVNSLLIAASTLVQHLADTNHPRHIHRQNCLIDVGIQIALHKLELSENCVLQNLSRRILEFFQAANL